MDDDSYPIEIAWLEPDGRILSHLIQPSWSWTDWSTHAAALHGITRDDLLSQGIEPRTLCHAMSIAWKGRTILSDAPVWDGHWLDRLWQAGARGTKPWIIGDLDAWLNLQLRGRYADPLSRQQRLSSCVAVAKQLCPPQHRAAADVAHLLRYCQEVIQM